MPTYFARKAGNINATDVWATTPSGTAGAVTFVAGDVLMANSFAVTINVSTALGASGEVRNDTTGGATAGGSFTLSNGVTLTSNVFAGTAACVLFSGTESATIVGSVRGGSINTAHGARNTTAGTLIISGDCIGGSTSGAFGAHNASTGSLNITGSCIGVNTIGANNASTGSLNITGSCIGGTGTGGSGQNAFGAQNTGVGVLSITGSCIGGSGASAFGAFNNSTGTMLIDGVIQSSELNAGVGGANPQQVTLLTGPFLISPTLGVNPIGCTAWRWASALNDQTYLEVGTQTLLQKRNLVTPDNATNFPAASNVRSGTAYGIGGVLSGTCVVPNPAQVAAGSPVDDTVGTLAAATAGEIATAVRSELSVELGRLDASISSRLAPSGTLATVTNLTNAPASVTPSDIWSHATRTLTSASGPTAVEIRQEIDANSSKLDVAISSRLADADYVEPANSDVAAIKAKTDALPSDPADQSLLEAAIAGVTAPSAATVASAVRSELSSELSKVSALNTERLANVATTAIVGNLIAQANS